MKIGSTRIGRMRLTVAGAALTVALSASASMGQNLVSNGGFESGLAGWVTFGNVFPEQANPPQFVPHAGTGLVSMFGNFSGTFNVSGLFQSFAASPGSQWRMNVFSRHFSGDAMVGAGSPDDNWAVMKIVFRDAANQEIGAEEATILDGTFPTDEWIAHTAIVATAPPGTVAVEPFLLYLQPAFAGGACHLDDVLFEGVETCYPDCNGDGQLNLADFGCFQTQFALADPYADCNGDGVLNLADFGCFQTQFALGCP